MKFAMPEQIFKHLIIHIALFKQGYGTLDMFSFLRFSKLARIGSFQMPIAQKAVKSMFLLSKTKS
jgi:hypothetical protein